MADSNVAKLAGHGKATDMGSQKRRGISLSKSLSSLNLAHGGIDHGPTGTLSGNRRQLGHDAFEIDRSPSFGDNRLHENGFIKLDTHDTSLVDEHIPNIEKFAEDLQTAINAAWPVRKQSYYEKVSVLLLSWEDDNMGVYREVRRLQYVFSSLYRFDVQEYRIPSKTPGKATTTRLISFLENDGSNTLLIVYYAGHARLGYQGSDPPIWAATDKVGTPTLPSGSVQQFLEEAEADALLLYDCCHSSHPAINVSGQGVTEVIAACGFETQAPAVGLHSFTNALIKELEEAFAGPPISVAELHGRVIGSLKNWKPGLLKNADGNVWIDTNGNPKYECHKRRTPVHCFLTNETPYRSIMLTPLSSDLSQAAVANLQQDLPSLAQTSQTRNDSEAASSTDPTSLSDTITDSRKLQVLFAVRLEDDFFLDDDGKKLRNWCDWLKNIPIGVENIGVEAVYKSCSTLVLLSIPIILWDMLPENAAYSFVGFIKSANKAHHILGEEQGTMVDAKLVKDAWGKQQKKYERRIRKAERRLKAALDELELYQPTHGSPHYYTESPSDSDIRSESEGLSDSQLLRPNILGSSGKIGEKPTRKEDAEEEPIRFLDAIGRRFNFPFQVAKTTAGMVGMINYIFLHIDKVKPHIEDGNYDLRGPDGRIISAEEWETIVQPGWIITMHLGPEQTSGSADKSHFY